MNFVVLSKSFQFLMLKILMLKLSNQKSKLKQVFLLMKKSNYLKKFQNLSKLRTLLTKLKSQLLNSMLKIKLRLQMLKLKSSMKNVNHQKNNILKLRLSLMLQKISVEPNQLTLRVTRKKEIKFKKKLMLIFKKDVILLLLLKLKEKNTVHLLRLIENVKKKNVRRRFKLKEMKDLLNVLKLNLNQLKFQLLLKKLILVTL